MESFAATAMSLAVLGTGALVAGGVLLLVRGTSRRQGALMLAAAAVLLANVVIWAL
jgi:hypothetical protein